jgi:hypothetical protein
MSLPKYARVAASIRAQIADGVLLPGQPAPSGAALARASGYSVLTCRRALRTLVKDGVLVPGHSRNARPRVPGPAPTPDEQTLAEAVRALSGALAARRRAFGLTQPELAVAIGVSVTTVGHAETAACGSPITFGSVPTRRSMLTGNCFACTTSTVPEPSRPPKPQTTVRPSQIPPPTLCRA